MSIPVPPRLGSQPQLRLRSPHQEKLRYDPGLELLVSGVRAPATRPTELMQVRSLLSQPPVPRPELPLSTLPQDSRCSLSAPMIEPEPAPPDQLPCDLLVFLQRI